jgi:endogenous inhibitor of DNA gyrase (YacG/DUF329 family)
VLIRADKQILRFAKDDKPERLELDAMSTPKALFCPTCRKVVLISDPEFPFCSERCRILDLGKWASGGYVISSPIHDPDLLDELEGLQGRATSATNQDRDR